MEPTTSKITNRRQINCVEAIPKIKAHLQNIAGEPQTPFNRATVKVDCEGEIVYFSFKTGEGTICRGTLGPSPVKDELSLDIHIPESEPLRKSLRTKIETYIRQIFM